jgi:hypothetical protein
MKKTLITLAAILITLTACNQFSAKASSLPTTIQDPQLLQAWTTLNSLTETVQLPGGVTLTGHDLAQYIFEHNVPVVWDDENVCSGSSCSLRLCAGDTCSYGDVQSGIEPIHIRISLRANVENQMTDLVEVIAHETYHHMLPFGQVHDTLYEEYWAFEIGVQISKSGWITDTCTNPLQTNCLKGWFEEHNLMYAYSEFQAYPSSVADTVDTTGQDCSLNADAGQPAAEVEVTAQPTVEGNLTCQANSMGLVECQNTIP